MPTLSSTLPGVRFVTQPPAPEQSLPRMDITAFVGFAASGPVNVPVPVEDLARFHDVFGGGTGNVTQVVLSWNASGRQMQPAQLALAVELFFRNGGTRCWVVRVAGPKATANRFALPGLISGDGHPVWARTRSEGSWSDPLRAATLRRSRPLAVRIATADAMGMTVSAETAPLVGDLCEIRWGKSGVLSYAVVVGVKGAPAGWDLAWNSDEMRWFSETNGSLSALSTTDGLAQATTWLSAQSPANAELPSAALLSFDLLIWNEDELIARLNDLAFSSRHPRFWERLPTDVELFQPTFRCEEAHSENELVQESAQPRFPLAGPGLPIPTREEPARFYVPLGMPRLAIAAAAIGRHQPGLDPLALERDGLGEFRADLFLDPELASVSSETLLSAAHAKYHLSSHPRPLRGLHSILPLPEVTLVSVPDAVHPGWERGKATLEEPVLPAPHLDPLSRPSPGDHLASWSGVAAAQAYELEESSSASFDTATAIYRGTAREFQFPLVSQCPAPRFYRVRAVQGTRISPWSNTRRTLVPPLDFEDCHRLVLAAPELMIGQSSPPRPEEFEIIWSPVAGATAYVLQSAGDPAFLTAQSIYSGKDTARRLADPKSGQQFFRVRAEADGNPEVGPWSTTIGRTSPPIEWRTVEPARYEETGLPVLAAVHCALLRCCRARGDILSILTLPRHFREREALEYVADMTDGRGDSGRRSRSEFPTLPPAESAALAFGAVYHPWVVVRGDGVGEASRLCPPDGLVCGLISREASRRGAWIAPANHPLAGPSALEPAISEAGWEQLYDRQVNVLRPDPRGFLSLSAETLSRQANLRPISVHRLLMLLRRLVLREGSRWVFAPSTPRFHRAAQRTLDGLLSLLYTRGAFVGDTPERAYQVSLPPALNPPQSLALGRLVIELKVAPAWPMAFITVRLVQEGGTLSVVTEA